jgi:phosphatidylserine decarboxylase
MIESLLKLIDRPGVNFALTNRVPRRTLTAAMARVSRIEHPLVRRLSIALWRAFAGDLALHEAKATSFRSLHEVFIRELRPGARPIDRTPGVVVSPCDGIVVGVGSIHGTTLLQAKRQAYTLEELLLDAALVERFHDGTYVTLRLTSTMYHRFHAPADGTAGPVTFVPGDTWNVNPATLDRVAKVYCRNTRVIVPIGPGDSAGQLALVAVGAILVASVQLAFLPEPLDGRYAGACRIPIEASVVRGQELGYFQHGSTIVVLASAGLEPAGITLGQHVQVGRPLLQHVHTSVTGSSVAGSRSSCAPAT